MPRGLLCHGVWRPWSRRGLGPGTLPSVAGATGGQHCPLACGQPRLSQGSATHPPPSPAPTGAARPALPPLQPPWGKGAAELSLCPQASEDGESVGHCPFCQRIFMVLLLKGVPFTLTTVDAKR